METKIGHQENDRSSSSLDMKTGGAVLLNYPLGKEIASERVLHPPYFLGAAGVQPLWLLLQFQVPSVPPCKIILLLTVVLFLHINATVSLNFMPYIFFLLFERNPSYQERSTQHKNTIVFFFTRHEPRLARPSSGGSSSKLVVAAAAFKNIHYA